MQTRFNQNLIIAIIAVSMVAGTVSVTKSLSTNQKSSIRSSKPKKLNRKQKIEKMIMSRKKFDLKKL